jgi:hypothetical protein
MATPTPISPGSRRPFDALDAEWALLCRRHRRSSVVADWARQQPALASVARLGDAIPPAGADRRPYCQALAVLAAAGDDLAARALLQLLVPGLVRLAARWRWQLDGMSAAGWDRPRRPVHRPARRHPDHRQRRRVAAALDRTRPHRRLSASPPHQRWPGR